MQFKSLYKITGASILLFIVAGCANQMPPTAASNADQSGASATTDATKIKNWPQYTNNRVGYSFKNPDSSTSTLLYDVIKYPSNDQDGLPSNKDQVAFGIRQHTFDVKVYVGEVKTTIDDWLLHANTTAFRYGADRYQKIKVDGYDALQLTDQAFIFIAVNNNIYEAAVFDNVSRQVVAVSDEPLFETWIASFKFH